MPTMHDSASALTLYVTDGMAKTVGELVTVKTCTEGLGSAGHHIYMYVYIYNIGSNILYRWSYKHMKRK